VAVVADARILLAFGQPLEMRATSLAMVRICEVVPQAGDKT